MRQVIALALVPIIATTPAPAAPGVTTSSVNFRSGPGTSFSSIRTLPEGTAVDMGDCEDSGSWCAVTVEGRSGFVSGLYLHWSGLCRQKRVQPGTGATGWFLVATGLDGEGRAAIVCASDRPPISIRAKARGVG
ncbi:SH3 domain-containing protein [Microvirga vignae]|uniref:SH3 domain-containing protein n=1 Tax=Microvirga vignae TaxID=1225564 RepID=UPI00069A4F54|nr:SH3 domain-containing protein [Microvirga vignae]